MDWLLLGYGLLTSASVHYLHQTSKVADASYPVMKPPAEVTVVVPAYNEEAYIERTLVSVKNQNVLLAYPEMFEVVVADNLSTDRTAELASKHVKVVSVSPRGILHVRDQAFHFSGGDIVLFLDGDSIVQPNCFNLLLRHFHDPEVVAVGGGIDPSNVGVGAIYLIYDNFLNGLLGYRLYGGICAIRKTAYLQTGGFNLAVNQFNRAELHVESELNIVRKLRQVGKVVIDSEVTAWSEPRIMHCLINPPDEFCDSPYCRYCRERAKGQRF